MLNCFKEFIALLLLTSFFVFGMLYSMKKEDELILQHCSGLSGYEYGQCQASIY